MLQNQFFRCFQLTETCSDKMFWCLGRYTQQYYPTALFLSHLRGNHHSPSQVLHPYFLPLVTQEKVGEKGLCAPQSDLQADGRQHKLGIRKSRFARVKESHRYMFHSGWEWGSWGGLTTVLNKWWGKNGIYLPNQACCSPWTSIANPKSASLTAAPLDLLARSKFSGFIQREKTIETKR